ncbi:AraC family transcriptional regulator [Draconibacterium mangrovi]
MSNRIHKRRRKFYFSGIRKTGFSSPSVFSRKFKEKFKVSPSDYLRKFS